MARAKIRQKPRNQSISPTALWVLGDRQLYEKPEVINKWELVANPALKYPTTNFAACKALWDSAKDEILEDWIAEFPGTRPSFWWLFDAPRMSADDLQRNGWIDCFFSPQICDPRLRLGGTGTPRYECLNYVPVFHCGIPKSWVSPDEVRTYSEMRAERNAEPFAGKAIDLTDPPKFESQASYLKRHRLFMTGEERRLPAGAFEPEVVLPETNDSEAVN